MMSLNFRPSFFKVANKPFLLIVLNARVERRTLKERFNSGTKIVLVWIFGNTHFFVLLLALDTLFATAGRLPVSLHILDIIKSLYLPSRYTTVRRTTGSYFLNSSLPEVFALFFVVEYT
mgnify:CR=1 FL=1